MLHSTLDKHPPPPHTPPRFSSICPLSTLPPSPPLCPDHCPAHPSARGQWLTFKEKQEKRGARCHRIACLLTESLKAGPHKSKKSIIGIVSPRATCPTKIPLLCSLFSLPDFFFFLTSFAERVGKVRGGDFFIRGVSSCGFGAFSGFPHHFLSPSLSNHLLVLRSSDPQHLI